MNRFCINSLTTSSLGNILYTILTGHFPFDYLEPTRESTKQMKKLVLKGKRPHVNLDADIRNSKDPHEQTMLTAIEMCWKQDPRDRASAREVQALLAEYLPREHAREYHHQRARETRRQLSW